MGNTDSVPLVSQIKSLVQYAHGDPSAALVTQQNFAFNNTFPIISQISSAGHAINGDLDRALNLQKKFAKDMVAVIDSIPVAGHVKGSVHFALGENEKGEAAMKSASRSTGVVLGGLGGLTIGGPFGAVAGGVAGGAAVDGIITGSEILIHGPTARPHGYLAAGKEIVETVKGRRNLTTEERFDMAMVPISDGIGGFSAGTFIGKPLGLNTGGGKFIPIPARIGQKTAGGGGSGGVGGSKIVAVLDDAAIVKINAGKAGGVAKSGIGNLADDVANSNKLNLHKAALDNRANQLNPNHPLSGPGREAGYRGTGTKLDMDNHANQLNPMHPAYEASRVGGGAAVAGHVVV